jgi:hypothetical protein
MRSPSPRVALPALIGLLALPSIAIGGTLGRETPAERAEVIAKALQDLKNPGLKDAQRMDARERLLDRGAVTELMDLGKAATSDNVRMQVAIALGQERRDQSEEVKAKIRETVLANLDIFRTWLTEGGDAALRYWAAQALARAHSPASLEILKTALAEQTEPLIRSTIATALGPWQGESGAAATEVLLGLLADPEPDLRVAAIGGLRRSGVRDVEVVRRVLKAAKEDPEEAVWRAALLALQELEPELRLELAIRPGADDKERQRVLGVWERKWDYLLKKRERERGGGG